MSKLMRFQESEQLTLDEVLAEDESPSLQAGDLVTHVDFPDFRGQIETVDNGRCKVRVLDGWKGTMPSRAVPIPTVKLEVLS